MDTIPALLAVVLLAAVHIYGVRLTFSPAVPRSHWLSMAGGTAVALVFLHILPELSHGQEEVEASDLLPVAFIEQHVYLMALLGLVTFYGLEHAIKLYDHDPEEQESATASHVFWIHMGAFALYNAVIGYLLLHRELPGYASLALFTFAMMLHFVVNDHTLRERHQQDYHDAGRWILAVAVIAGWVAGLLIDISDALLSVLYAFIAGAIVLNVLKEELPSERQNRFWAFALGASLYSVLLLVVE